jgi:hypothetical protein
MSGAAENSFFALLQRDLPLRHDRAGPGSLMCPNVFNVGSTVDLESAVGVTKGEVMRAIVPLWLNSYE